jgi:hypothetical protein
LNLRDLLLQALCDIDGERSVFICNVSASLLKSDMQVHLHATYRTNALEEHCEAQFQKGVEACFDA